MFRELAFLLKITRSQGIARRYFIVNGFDGALTLLGLCMGFYVGGETDLDVIVTAGLGTAIALGVSGVSSAYVSEVAEKRRELKELERAMITDLSASAHARATRIVPYWIALVNGLAPFLAAFTILLPLLLARHGWEYSVSPLLVSVVVAFFIIFLFGVFLGWVSEHFWLVSGLRTLLIAVITSGLILLLH